jgi:PadR family transcriptional regulator PadR
VRELKKGSLSLLLLRLLSERPSYGYELCERLRQRSEGALSFEDGAIYPLLHEFERQQWIEGYWETTTEGAADGAETERRGPRRRYYRLTPRGVEALRAALADWQTFTAAVSRILAADSVVARVFARKMACLAAMATSGAERAVER